MRIHGYPMVPSFVALWLTALCALVGCSDGVSVTGTPDAAPQADAAADRSTPPPDVVPATDTPPSPDAGTDASTPPPDVVPATDTPPSPDAGTDATVVAEDHPLVWCGATFPEPGERCHRELPPGMPMGDFTEVGQGACSPASVSLHSGPGAMTTRAVLNCVADDHGVTYMDITSIVRDSGYAPCIGRICAVYMGPGMPIRGVQWDPVSRIGAAVIWAPGQSVNTTPMDDPSGGTVLY